MAYRDFTYPQVVTDLGLTETNDVDMFREVPSAGVPDHLADLLAEGVQWAKAVNTEKARSELIIAPVLFHIKRTAERGFGLFSGITFDVDPDRGLNGVADFLLSREPRQHRPTAPIMAIAEGKNVDVRAGFGQCIAGYGGCPGVQPAGGDSRPGRSTG